MPRATGPNCGQAGGVVRGGAPCTRPAGWGTDHPGTGCCKAHDTPALERLREQKREFLTILGSGTVALLEAAKRVGASVPTVWHWRQDDPEFDAQVRAAIEASDRVRVALVEDSLFSRIVAGKASAAETIFFLVNRSGGRWRHVQTVEHSGPGGGPVAQEVTVRFVQAPAPAG